MSGKSPEKEKSPEPEGDTSESSSKKRMSPAELLESLESLEKRCVGLQERFRVLVKPDILRKMEEAKEMADEIGRRMDKVRKCEEIS